MEWFSSLQPQVQAALISAVVSAVVAILLAVVNPAAQRRLERAKADLQRELEAHKIALARGLEDRKATLQGAINREVQLQLGERAAQREYEYDARKRLYVAIGPLRFQLLASCRACASRIEGLGGREQYDLAVDGYFGRNTLYRLLVPLAIVELIERQLGYSDFSIDQGALDCLRLKKSFASAWSGDEVVLGHPELDWTRQVQHVFGGSRTRAANALISEGTGTSGRVLRFDEFLAGDTEKELEQLKPFPDLLNGFSIQRKPILWARLVAYGHSCNAYINRNGVALGFEEKDFPAESLLVASGDGHIVSHAREYLAIIEANGLPKL